MALKQLQLQVLLKYRGSFHSMLTSDYFIGEVQKNEFFYKCSAKVPFYFIHECSPSQTDADMLMSKYLENPFNPMMFITYNQRVEGLRDLDCSDARVERTLNLDIAYQKFKDKTPTLICIGNPSSMKSTLLNDIFGVQFEVMCQGMAGLFQTGSFQ